MALGSPVRLADGGSLGLPLLSVSLGLRLGITVGFALGSSLGSFEGGKLSRAVGCSLGCRLGSLLGPSLGDPLLSSSLGFPLGNSAVGVTFSATDGFFRRRFTRRPARSARAFTGRYTGSRTRFPTGLCGWCGDMWGRRITLLQTRLTTWGGARYARGTLDGDLLGCSPLGVLLGSKLGYVDGPALVIGGCSLGCQLGSELGSDESSPVGAVDGFSEGEPLGAPLPPLPLSLGTTLGFTDGFSEGDSLGAVLVPLGLSLDVTLGLELGSTLGCVDGAELCGSADRSAY
jgi:hypothetical protein